MCLNNNLSFDAKKLFGNHQTKILPESFGDSHVESIRIGVNAIETAYLLMRCELSNRRRCKVLLREAMSLWALLCVGYQLVG